jgi:hypothetical protein
MIFCKEGPIDVKEFGGTEQERNGNVGEPCTEVLAIRERNGNGTGTGTVPEPFRNDFRELGTLKMPVRLGA